MQLTAHGRGTLDLWILKQGHGVYTWANGAKYDGEYKDNKKNGHGLHTWPDGSIYEGERLLNNQRVWV